MATGMESNDEDDELKNLDKEISYLRSAKKEWFEKARPVSDELERIAQRERECIDKQNHLRSKQHDREKLQQTDQHVIDLKAELKQAKDENVKLSNKVINLKQSLDKATKFSKDQKRKITELENNMVTLPEGKMVDVSVQVLSETEDRATVIELQLSDTMKLLSKTQVHLSNVEEQLTVAKQVTAATQQRELQESGNFELQLELSKHHQPTTCTGILTGF